MAKARVNQVLKSMESEVAEILKSTAGHRDALKKHLVRLEKLAEQVDELMEPLDRAVNCLDYAIEALSEQV